MTEQEKIENYLEAQKMAAFMTTATHRLKQKLKTFKQPMTNQGRHSMLLDIAEIRGYLDVVSTMVVCAR